MVQTNYKKLNPANLVLVKIAKSFRINTDKIDISLPRGRQRNFKTGGYNI